MADPVFPVTELPIDEVAQLICDVCADAILRAVTDVAINNIITIPNIFAMPAMLCLLENPFVFTIILPQSVNSLSRI